MYGLGMNWHNISRAFKRTPTEAAKTPEVLLPGRLQFSEAEIKKRFNGIALRAERLDRAAMDMRGVVGTYIESAQNNQELAPIRAAFYDRQEQIGRRYSLEIYEMDQVVNYAKHLVFELPEQQQAKGDDNE
ncbi:MAG: hypothetical protein JWO41_259 [Candidatus Saccharibacteria bacterium]|nr:hypothetical protein [Candidatus Saccharibacteria bacterium]